MDNQDMTRVNKIIDTANVEMGLRKTSMTDEEANSKLEKEAIVYAKHFLDILPDQIKFNPENVFEEIKDGVVLGYVLHSIKNSCIETRKLVKCNQSVMDKKFIYEANSNLSYVLTVAKKIGVKIVNIGAEDILYENKGLVLGLLWQLVRLSVSRKSNVLRHPELMNLINENESIEDLCNRTPEEMCMRWINYHLKNAIESGLDKKINELMKDNPYGNHRNELSDVHAVFSTCYKSREGNLQDFVENVLNQENKHFPDKCSNFTTDIKDSRIYLILLKQLVPELISDTDFIDIWVDVDLYRRAKKVLEIAEKIECNKFVTETEIVNGTSRLNFLFCQTIMNKFPGMESGENIELLRQKIYEYENNITVLEENLNAANFTVKQKENIEKEMLELEEDLLRTIDEKAEEYETVIDDLRVSQDSFAYKIDNYVEEEVGIANDNNIRDSRERIWSVITLLVDEIKTIRTERDNTLEKLERLKDINSMIDLKLQEYVEWQNEYKNREEAEDDGWFSKFFCC